MVHTWLDVAMEDVVRVALRHRAQNCAHVAGHRALAVVVAAAPQLAARAVRHDDVHVVTVLVHRVQLDHVEAQPQPV